MATLPQKEETLNPFKYTGEVYDEETGLYYLRARYYDPSMRRFLNEDTYEGQIDNPLSLNLYTYVINNPLKYIDPTGNMHEMGGKSSGGSGGGGAYTVPKWLVSEFKFVKTQSPRTLPKNLKIPTDSANSSSKLRAEVNTQRNNTKGTGEVEKALTTYNPQFAAQQMLKNGKVPIENLESMVPNGAANGFKPSATIADGYKYNYEINGTKIEIKWHAPDANAAAKFPSSNSGSGWTAQIKVGNKLLGQDGKFYRNPSNITHIPVDFGR
ncbi:RHS repeat-associated core domain-containing protein [Paenibacillus odorifer]|uniref:RHS repeat-associated core domain-containing protein n=1 Tax=Paenibacillus odorifer TaxID=189426 RepID=UPI00096BDEC9|nr:RHS repeat-associated core domain-containing protein [Paenibacillus odorifer]